MPKEPKFPIVVRLLIVILFISSHAFAQIEISGRVTDKNNKPLPGTNIFVNGNSLSTSSDSKGEFYIKIPDSTYLTFMCFSLTPQRIKCTESKRIEVKLQDPSDGPWKLEGGEKPLFVEKNKQGTTFTYAIDTLHFKEITSKRIVTWKLDKYSVSLPFDSLIGFIRVADPDNEFILNFLSLNSQKDIVFISQAILEKIHERLLHEFILSMIRSNSLAITGSNGSVISRLIVKDVYWSGSKSKCGGCCWGGLQFFIYEKGTPMSTLCTITTTIC